MMILASTYKFLRLRLRLRLRLNQCSFPKSLKRDLQDYELEHGEQDRKTTYRPTRYRSQSLSLHDHCHRFRCPSFPESRSPLDEYLHQCPDLFLEEEHR